MTDVNCDYWDSVETGRILGFPARRIRIWCEDGKLPAYKICGQWRINKKELNKWIRERKNDER